MQKVLIISYFAPPCHLTGANRVESWMKHFPDNDIYPILVTRNWDGIEVGEGASLKNSSSITRHVVKDNSEYYYLPYRSTMRDRAFMRSKNSFFFKYLSKLLTFFGLFLQNISIRFIPYQNLHEQARLILKEQADIKTVVISGNPFEQFFFGYLLKKEFNNIAWFADYRDDWTTNPLYSDNLSNRIFKNYNQYFEKKWVSTASAVLTVSELYCNRLAKLHGRECNLLRNGYNDELLEVTPKKKGLKFQITYSGTIYPRQDFSSVISVIDKIATKKQDLQFEFTFLGSLGFISSEQRKVLEQKTSANFNINITERIPWKESIAFAKSSDVLLIGSYGNLKGVIPSKIFEYASMGVPVVCYPSDDDVIHDILKKSNTSLLCHTEEECHSAFKTIVEGKFDFQPNKKEIIKFSSKHQVSILAQILKE